MANTNALFISEARLKSLTAVHENVEPDDLMPYVVQAQDIYLQDVLGTKLFNSLKALIVAGTALNAYQLTLIEDYISPTIANYSLYLAIPTLNYKFKNKSILNPSSEESLNTGFSEMKYLRESVLDTAQFYMTRTQEYLCDNSSQFPDFTQPGNDGMMPNPRSPYNSGIVMPHSTGCGCGSVTLCNC
jgi:hypothetical protein|tara:strand:+ start:1578 stop:2138 length:561 start_codon:yes stop_codon:yes gene_type:complete